MELAKKIYLDSEGDKWFERNEKLILQLDENATVGIRNLYEFLIKQKELNYPVGRVLEVGCRFWE